MQSPIRQVIAGVRQDGHRAASAWLLKLLWLLTLWCAGDRVLGAEVAMTVELPVGQFKAVRLRNLPKDTVMAFQIESSGKLLAMLVNEQDSKRFPNPEEPLFAGSIDRRLSFTIAIPASGNYFLVFDNRQGAETLKVKFVIRAERGRAQPPPQSQPRPEAPSPAPPPPAPKGLEKL
jgi:hypothetical protein